jgi:hypothetical protein
MQIASKADFIQYIKYALGFPSINVELDCTQLGNIIDDCVQEFRRYNAGEGSYEDYAIFNISAGVNTYSLSAEDIQNVYDLQSSFGINGINTLFSPTHILLYADWVQRGNYPGGSGGLGGQGLVLTEYDLAMNYLEEISNRFGRKFQVRYREQAKELKVFPTPTEDSVGILCLWRNELATNLYNHSLVKKLAVARAKVMWGGILRKFVMTIPGGGSISGADIVAEGKEEETKALDSIRLESTPPRFFVE